MTYLQLDTHYVYSHSRGDDGSVFYIGKGSGNRHASKSKRNDYWKNIVNKSGGFSSKIIASGLTEIEAYSFERILIQAIKNQTTMKLSNLIGGGRGGSFNPSDETRAKQRAAKLGGKLSFEQRAKISAANRCRVYKSGYSMNLTDEQRATRSERTKSQVWTEARKANISAAKVGHKHSEETKKKISEAKKGVKWTEAQMEARKRGQ